MDNFEYDKYIFLKNCFTSKKELKLMSKDQLIGMMILNCHRLEKGLSMKNISPNFGTKNKTIERLRNMHEEYLKRVIKNPENYGKEDRVLTTIYNSILEYYNWHNKNNISCKSKWIKLYLDKYKPKSKEKTGGTKEMNKSEILKKINLDKDFFFNRRSIRDYAKKDIDINDIKRCINKSLHGTPTVCNRPINKVYIIKEPKIKEKILSLQTGNKGFGEKAPIILIITSRLSYFRDQKERRQPYIGGGMFCMSLIYALYSEGFATCPLNFDTSFNNEMKLKDILGIRDETIIMYIAVGNYKDKIRVAISNKPQLEEVIKII